MHQLFLSLIFLLSACQPLVQEKQKTFPPPETVIVQFIIDGDTIVTDLGAVRLVGIDAPEKGKCGYEEASERLRILVDKKTVTLVDDTKQQDRDDYGRLLRYIEINDEDAGTILIREGFVQAFPWIQSDRLDMYQKLEQAARDTKEGILWEKCIKSPAT